MAEYLDAIEIETARNPATSVIWLHGLGADGNDFAPIVPGLQLPKTAIRFVFPHAPVQPVTINGGMRMRAWYDISDGAIRREDEKGVRASQALIEALIAREKERGTAASRLVLADSRRAGRSPCTPGCAMRSASPASWRCRPICRLPRNFPPRRTQSIATRRSSWRTAATTPSFRLR